MNVNQFFWIKVCTQILFTVYMVEIVTLCSQFLFVVYKVEMVTIVFNIFVFDNN